MTKSTAEKIADFFWNHILRGALGAGVDITGKMNSLTPTHIAQANNHHFASFEYFPRGDVASPYKLLLRKSNWHYGFGIFLIINVLALYITMGLEIGFRTAASVISSPFRLSLKQGQITLENLKKYKNLDDEIKLALLIFSSILSLPFLLMSQPFGLVADIFLYSRELLTAIHLVNPVWWAAKLYEEMTDEITPTPSLRVVIKNVISSLVKLTPALLMTSAIIAVYPKLAADMTHIISSVPDAVALTGIICGAAAGCKIFTTVSNEFITKKICNQFYTDKIRKESQKIYVKEQRKKVEPKKNVELQVVSNVEKTALLDQEVKTPTPVSPAGTNAYLQLLKLQPLQSQDTLQRTPHSKKRTPQESPDSINKKPTLSKTGLFHESPTKQLPPEKIEKQVSRRLSYSETSVSRRPSLSISIEDSVG